MNERLQSVDNTRINWTKSKKLQEIQQYGSKKERDKSSVKKRKTEQDSAWSIKSSLKRESTRSSKMLSGESSHWKLNSGRSGTKSNKRATQKSIPPNKRMQNLLEEEEKQSSKRKLGKEIKKF